MYIPILSIHTHPFLWLEYSHKTCCLECCSLTDSFYSMTPVPRTPITLVLSGYTHSSSIQHTSFIPSIWILCWIFPLGNHHTATRQCRRGGRGWAFWVPIEAAPWTWESTQTLRYGCSLQPHASPSSVVSRAHKNFSLWKAIFCLLLLNKALCHASSCFLWSELTRFSCYG